MTFEKASRGQTDMMQQLLPPGGAGKQLHGKHINNHCIAGQELKRQEVKNLSTYHCTHTMFNCFL